MSLVRTIDAMVAAGCSPEQLAAVVRAHAAADQERLEAKRAADAERQRKSRLSRNVTVTECDECDDSPIKETSPRPPKENYPLSSEPTVPRCDSARRHEWPVDFAEQVWSIYPRKTEKKLGMEALARLHRSDRLAWVELVEGVETLFGCDPQFVPALARWLKGERWKDERPIAKPPPSGKPERNTRSLIDGLDEIERRFSDVPPAAYPRLAG